MCGYPNVFYNAALSNFSCVSQLCAQCPLASCSDMPAGTMVASENGEMKKCMLRPLCFQVSSFPPSLLLSFQSVVMLA